MTATPRASSPIQRRWRRTVSGLILLSFVFAVRLTYGTLFMFLPVAAVLVAGAYAIAQGGAAWRRPFAPRDAEREWLNDTLAVPFLIDVAATFVEWLVFALTILLVVTWDAPSKILIDVLTSYGVLAIFFLMGILALAMTAWERRNAKRALGADGQTLRAP